MRVSDWRSTLTFKGMLMQPRKSSAFSSEPEDADPLARTDLAICLKYLAITSKKQGKASSHNLYCQKSPMWRERRIWFSTFPFHEVH